VKNPTQKAGPAISREYKNISVLGKEEEQNKKQKAYLSRHQWTLD
jgi:hypothetical protein